MEQANILCTCEYLLYTALLSLKILLLLVLLEQTVMDQILVNTLIITDNNEVLHNNHSIMYLRNLVQLLWEWYPILAHIR